MKARTLVLGDVHGGHKALLQVFKRSGFDKEKDTLICLGDVADGWDETKQCFDELLKIQNLVYVLGNHDKWLLEWFTYGNTPNIWITQGGANTLKSYDCYYLDAPEEHRNLLNSAPAYYIDSKNRVFVLGGFDLNFSLTDQRDDVLLWDRNLLAYAHMVSGLKDVEVPKKLQVFNEILLGHTTTSQYGQDTPMHCCNVWNLDTGAGWEGKLTLMNVDTKEYWQSDKVSTLYPHLRGRG